MTGFSGGNEAATSGYELVELRREYKLFFFVNRQKLVSVSHLVASGLGTRLFRSAGGFLEEANTNSHFCTYEHSVEREEEAYDWASVSWQGSEKSLSRQKRTAMD